jgi:hypothetical protein
MRLVSRLALPVLFALVAAAPAAAQERYFVMVFGAQKSLVTPQYTHSWAMFVRTCGPCLGDAELDYFTISWLSQRMVVEVKRLRPEPGANLDNDTTMAWCRENNMRVSMWGPFEINRDLWVRAQKRVDRLESGEIQYRALDTGRPYDGKSNCIHAIADPEVTGRLRGNFVTALTWGEPASRIITLSLRHEMIDPRTTHPEIADRLLGDWPVTRRDFGRFPTVGPRVRRFGG